MLGGMRTWIAFCFIASAVALVTAPNEASACSPEECYVWTEFSIAHSSPIPADGVLVLAAKFGNGSPVEEDLAAFNVEVSGEGGEIINGVLTLNDAPLAVIWRPDEPLMPGLVYDVVASVDNTIFGDVGSCAEEFFSTEGSFETAPTGLPETIVPPIEVVEDLYLPDDFSLDSMVCCDGAFPVSESCFGEVDWLDGYCASLVENWRVKLSMTLDAEVMAANGGQIGVLGWSAGDLEKVVSYGEDKCFETSAVNFATGEIVAGESVCVSAESAAELGPKAVDPSADLDAKCTGEPYTCTDNFDGWNKDECEPWPDSGSGTTTGTTTGTDSDGTDSETSDSGGGTSITDSGTSSTTDDGSSTGEDSASTTSGEDDSGSCACDVDGGSPFGLAWLGLALPIVWRRRRH